MALQRVMERRQVYDARVWDRSQECLDWMDEHGGMNGSPFSISEADGELYQWGAFLLPPGTWLIYRGGWWDILPDEGAYRQKYEVVAAPMPVPPAEEEDPPVPGALTDDTPPAEDTPPPDDTPSTDDTPPAGDTPPAEDAPPTNDTSPAEDTPPPADDGS